MRSATAIFALLIGTAIALATAGYVEAQFLPGLPPEGTQVAAEPLRTSKRTEPYFSIALSGFSAAGKVRELSLSMRDDPDSSGSVVCQSDDGVLPACLLLLLPTASATTMEELSADVLGGLQLPPLQLVRLGNFNIWYYFPGEDRHEFELRLQQPWLEPALIDTLCVGHE